MSLQIAVHNFSIDDIRYYNERMEMHETQKKLLKYLKNIEDLEGISLRHIAREVGLNNAQTVSHHLKQLEKHGYIRRNLSNPALFEILKDPVEDIVYLDLLGFAQCGNEAEFFSDGNLKEKIAISTKLFGIRNPQDAFLVRAKGDSMLPDIVERDLILCDKRDDVDSGSIALVIDGDEPKLKRVIKKSRNEYILNSINRKYNDKSVKRGRDFRILGVGVSVIRGL